MKIVIYHISDLHIEKEEDGKVNNVYKMADVLNSIGDFEIVFIIVSGDIAFSGRREQYAAAYHLFGTLISSIKKKFINKKIIMLAVPGNHDVDLSIDEGHKMIQDKIRSGVTSEMIAQELEKQKNYLNYANGIHSLDNSDKLCCIKEYEIKDKKINVCLINTAIFSTLDEDKGLHFIPEDVMKKMDNKLDADINITVLHHSHHWMNDSVKNSFENILFLKNNIILCGHEHGLDTKEIHKDRSRVIYLTGGELCNKGNWSNSQFYLNIIDTEYMTLESISYIWNKNRQLYILES